MIPTNLANDKKPVAISDTGTGNNSSDFYANANDWFSKLSSSLAAKWESLKSNWKKSYDNATGNNATSIEDSISFSADDVQRVFNEIETLFDDFAKHIGEMNEYFETHIDQDVDSVILTPKGTYASRIFKAWTDNASTFTDFKASFQSWSDMVAKIQQSNGNFAEAIKALYGGDEEKMAAFIELGIIPPEVYRNAMPSPNISGHSRGGFDSGILGNVMNTADNFMDGMAATLFTPGKGIVTDGSTLSPHEAAHAFENFNNDTPFGSWFASHNVGDGPGPGSGGEGSGGGTSNGPVVSEANIAGAALGGTLTLGLKGGLKPTTDPSGNATVPTTETPAASSTPAVGTTPIGTSAAQPVVSSAPAQPVASTPSAGASAPQPAASTTPAAETPAAETPAAQPEANTTPAAETPAAQPEVSATPAAKPAASSNASDENKGSSSLPEGTHTDGSGNQVVVTKDDKKGITTFVLKDNEGKVVATKYQDDATGEYSIVTGDGQVGYFNKDGVQLDVSSLTSNKPVEALVEKGTTTVTDTVIGQTNSEIPAGILSSSTGGSLHISEGPLAAGISVESAKNVYRAESSAISDYVSNISNLDSYNGLSSTDKSNVDLILNSSVNNRDLLLDAMDQTSKHSISDINGFNSQIDNMYSLEELNSYLTGLGLDPIEVKISGEE